MSFGDCCALCPYLSLFMNNCMLFNVTNKPPNQTPFLYMLVLSYETESNPLLNRTLPLEKLLAFFLKLFQNTP
jgi:hypothetical protein